jgi:hypothetical protein
MISDWNLLSDDLQLTLSREALRRAAETIAGQAEILAGEIEAGTLADRGGPDALRLLAAVVRASRDDPFTPEGHA